MAKACWDMICCCFETLNKSIETFLMTVEWEIIVNKQKNPWKGIFDFYFWDSDEFCYENLSQGHIWTEIVEINYILSVNRLIFETLNQSLVLFDANRSRDASQIHSNNNLLSHRFKLAFHRETFQPKFQSHVDLLLFCLLKSFISWIHVEIPRNHLQNALVFGESSWYTECHSCLGRRQEE